ncbi:uncharacterized protein M6B38_328150 [Iris pallida]|uniref:NET domain-containing protein n=1 Tax=Iris pallida TaxID=29817 RepID=A0AAX6H5V8_IRIPA|nr:uncharacterized protein M6B38_382195 [Iris pallida]KAJ6836356.1 uncharacterized protein M6B38_328150 [Iris pallida]
MSQFPRNASASQKPNDFGPNYLGYYKQLLLDLFSLHENGTLPFLGADSQISTAACCRSEPEHNHDEGSSSSFMSGGISGNSEFEEERLISILNESAVCLNQEVDEVFNHMLASLQINSDLRETCSSSASDEDLSMPRRSRKRKAPQPSSYNSSKNSIRQLGKMEEDLEGLLNVVVSKCRQMTLPEKYMLGKKIQKLPQKALDRVVDIIQSSNKVQDGSPTVFVDLKEVDDVTLWRLHYFVELVTKENKK